ncbi:hypothetical protein OIU79_030338 [Salix purpurea]|uniref:Uncharacterized protein n=1 Tax=Salix purpurea TaxID=77065 RepID=A0A9Q0V8B9_SALPP|nr:hypothetical protein OIU79_030338 [Salix purpurea]
MRRKYEQIAHGLCTCSNIILVYLELLQLKKLKLSFETVIKDLFIRVHRQCSYSLGMAHDDLYSVPYNPGTNYGICAPLNNVFYVDGRRYLFTHGGALGFLGKDVGLQLHEKEIPKATLALKMMQV